MALRSLVKLRKRKIRGGIATPFASLRVRLILLVLLAIIPALGFILYDAVDHTGLHLAVGLPKQVAFAEADRIWTRNLTILGLVGLLALVAAWKEGTLIQVIVPRIKEQETLTSVVN